MNLPPDYREDMTDEELVDAWVRIGKSREQAEVKMRIFRHRKGGVPLD